MQDRKEAIIKTKEFLELWKKFDHICKDAMKKTSITEEEEDLFLDTKSVVARKLQILVDSLPVERTTVDRAFDIINKIISLKSIATLSEEALRKINNDWHQTYISLNRLLGHLEAQKDSDMHHGPKAVEEGSASIGRFAAYFVIIIVFALAIFFLARILGILQ